MPGFMGLRGLEINNPHDAEKERRGDNRAPHDDLSDKEKRSWEKVQEILKDQVDAPPPPSVSDTASFRSVRGDGDTCTGVTVGEIMAGRVAVLTFDDDMLTVKGIFSSVRFHHLPVVDEEGSIIGIVSDRDFLRFSSPFMGTVNEQNRDKELLTRRVGVVMTRDPVCVEMDTSMVEAIQFMNSRKVSCLPVVEKGSKKLLGIVTWKDIVRALCPDGFASPRDSARLKTGVHINPVSTESQRLKTKAAESVRFKAKPAGDADPERESGQAPK